ncbi:ShlB/FhaC/HecB family hemolysin secretion/activation protein [Salmonella enterica]|uniref:ShlB/FhaC/HecB family hemolysin secretion/activation protein n=1 Tax=Salmonella diarizonae TaxID=59204 RepID=A0A8E9ZQT5_SALDZ|nr:ShlB/FhaC/HecB family hemolysin secretion/activation protein [Salmonella enterica subsp. diarizonae]
MTFTGPVLTEADGAPSALRMQEVVAPWLKRPLSFSELQRLTEAVTAEYRRHGFLLARAALPPQTVRDGVLMVSVTPGRYDAAVIRNTSSLREGLVRDVVSGTLPAGQLVKKDELERGALLLSEIPGVHSQVSLMPGAQPGTTTPDIVVKDGKRVGGYLGMDNQGNRTTGRTRLLGGGVLNNPTGLGDQLRMDLIKSGDKSFLFSGGLDYSLPAGSSGLRVGTGYSRLNYRYDFMQHGFSGYSDNWMVYAGYPWVRTGTARADIRLEGGQQYLTDRYPRFMAGNRESEGRKRQTTVSLGVSGSMAGLPGGVTGFFLQGTRGTSDYRNEMARQMAFSRETGSGGGFYRLNYELNHEQQLWGGMAVYGRLAGQQAGSNLDSAQKFLLGGPSGVRAYGIGQGSVNSGNVLSLELRWRTDLPSSWGLAGNTPGLTVATFWDQGWGEQYKSPGSLTNSNHLKLSGAGLYTTLSERDNYALTASWAQRTGEKDPVSGRSDRDQFWLSAAKLF